MKLIGTMSIMEVGWQLLWLPSYTIEHRAERLAKWQKKEEEKRKIIYKDAEISIYR